jgi:excinuclease ABC subunit C
VAKGATRKAGFETLYLNDAAHEFTLKGDSPALHLIQQIRDEAHRFAITGTAPVVAKPGVPPPGRRGRGWADTPARFVETFWRIAGAVRASIDEIAKAPGISKKLAELIYANLHSE